MKKSILLTTILAVFVLAFAACGDNAIPAAQPQVAATAPVETPAPPAPTPAAAEEPEAVERPREWVTVTDFNGNVVQVQQNPTRVAIKDNGILDMLYAVGFERTGIEWLIVPTRETLPDAISWFRPDGDSANTDINIHTGGTLFYVDWDVLDIVQPELVILGARSFAMNRDGDRHGDDATAQFRADTEARYANTQFIRLTINARDSDLLNDMRNNAYVLAQIFTEIGDDLMALVDEIEAEMNAIAEITSALDYRAIFVMMTQPTALSVFVENSRFDMIFEEFGFNAVDIDVSAFADQHGFDARAEFLLQINPDVIFLLDRTEADGWGAATDNFMADPIIQRTNAFVNGHIYSGLPTGEWYTVVGGINSARRMIEDVNRFIENLNN